MRPLALLSLLLLLAAPASAADKAPGFTLRDLDGRSVSLSQYSGQVVLLSFWATWCTPCQAEMPHLQRFHDQYGPQGFSVLSINTDDARSVSQVKPIIKARQLTFPVLLDRETTVVGLFNPAKTLPFSVLIDRQGAIAKVFSGYTPGDEVLVEQAVQASLVQPAQAASTP
ncbi:MAG: TlpA family protein disulfide reductase [Deltaproteobacteria bacterium]|nr:TlpA family protein disulfide reductase [Deltaproteobacteria bacterium]